MHLEPDTPETLAGTLASMRVISAMLTMLASAENEDISTVPDEVGEAAVHPFTEMTETELFDTCGVAIGLLFRAYAELETELSSG